MATLTLHLTQKQKHVHRWRQFMAMTEASSKHFSLFLLICFGYVSIPRKSSFFVPLVADIMHFHACLFIIHVHWTRQPTPLTYWKQSKDNFLESIAAHIRNTFSKQSQRNDQTNKSMYYDLLSPNIVYTSPNKHTQNKS